MSAMACRICEGELEPFRAGRAGTPTPADFAPSNHRPGEHGALLRCATCGTVQQPGLPSGDRIAHLLLALRADEAGFATVANHAFAGARWRVRRRLPARQRHAVDAAAELDRVDSSIP